MGRNSKRYLREYLARTRGLPPLPTGTPAEGSIQVAGAPNDGNNGAASLPGRGTRGRVADPPPVRRTRIGLTDRGVSCGQGPQLTCALRSQRTRPDGSHNPRRKTTPVPGVRAQSARARRSRAVFRLPVGAARHANADVPPRKHSRYGSGDSLAEALRPRRGGGRDAVHPSADPWRGRRRLWPKANRRRRGGQGGIAPCGFFPPFLVRTRNGAARRGGTRQSPSPKAAPIKHPEGARTNALPPAGRKSLRGRRRPTTDKLRRFMSGKPKNPPRRAAQNNYKVSCSP